jgi:hypothetical protein
MSFTAFFPSIGYGLMYRELCANKVNYMCNIYGAKNVFCSRQNFMVQYILNGGVGIFRDFAIFRSVICMPLLDRCIFNHSDVI